MLKLSFPHPTSTLSTLLLLAAQGLGCSNGGPKPGSSAAGGSGGNAALAGGANGAAAGIASGGSSAASAGNANNAGATATGGAAPEPFQTENLLLNGDAESGDSAWLAQAAPAAIKTEKYGANTFPAASDVGPANRGASFFYGGPSASADSHQRVDVTAFADQIVSGARFSLSAYLGGSAGQDDRAAVVLQLLAADGSNLGTETLGGPYAAERVGTTALLANKLDGKLPIATRAIDVHLVMTRASGTDDDGYADNLALTLHN